MSVAAAQHALTSKKHDLTSVAKSHKLRLRELRSVTAAIANNTGLSNLLKTQHDSEDSSFHATDDDDFLRSNDLLSGRYFDETTLPFPSLPQHDATIYASKPNRPSIQPPQTIPASASADGLATEAALTKPAESSNPMATAAVQAPSDIVAAASIDGRALATERQQDVLPDGSSLPPNIVAPPSAEDEANFSAATKDLLDLQSPQRPAKTVHLPPEEVQEERLRERKEAEEEGRRKSESEKLSRPMQLQAQTELASSPSSTIGAYSAATPMPPQESPDTSPDSETAAEEVLPPKDLRPTPEEQHAKEEHDRLLEVQKEIAHKEALAEPTPDDQLNWEAREAAAREEDEREACESVNGPEAGAKNTLEKTEAEHVMEDVQAEVTGQLPITPAPSHDEKTASQASVPASQVNAPASQEDGENITVTPRTKLPPPNIAKRQTPAATAPTPRMTTRVSSGAMNRRSVSEIIGDSPSQPAITPRTSRTVPSPEPVPPTNVENAQDDSNLPPAPIPQSQTPRRAPRPASHRTPSNREVPLIADLTALKGAAEDPDRDYLEPLFRIQAHDSPNSQTRPLPELVKSAQKYLSTEDQFTTMHERMDYRILRRIYQLQNANKWSLRQMEKAKEPEQPKTHLDHMMAEMKWMRKDFKAERKMKKSVCAWLAARCADWVAAEAEERKAMQIKVKPPQANAEASDISSEHVPELETSGDSAPEDDAVPPTPIEADNSLPMNLIIAPELSNVVCNLQKAGKLGRALQSLPVVGFEKYMKGHQDESLTAVSKFVESKVLPKVAGPARKRSRYDYEDDAELLHDEPETKRLREDRDLPPEEEEVALFHPDNKHIRDRLHANNAFRPPSEFVMPATSFYEFRNGSQWIWEDDQKLRKLAKEYSFNWSLIADEMTLPSRYKSSAERRTPWECFERWVELETLPAEMRKTMYFKTWFQRLEQSQQAAERRYQAQVAAIQAQAQNGQQVHVPQRRRTVPTRVEKRKNTRYLWLVDAMRKMAKKRENNAYKQAEAQRAAAQRKSQSDNNTPQRSGPQLTPQEFSKKRHERDLQIQEAQRQHRNKMIEAQQRQLMNLRAAQQQGATPNGIPGQPRPGSSSVQPHPGQMPNGQPNVNMNGQLPQQARPPLPMATRNGHLAVPQVNAQGIPQAQMRPNMPMTQQDVARIAQVNAQRAAQYGGQGYQMPNGNAPSPGSNMTTQQQLQHNQALLAQMQQQGQNHSASHANGQQMSASPSMPPPPTPHSQQQQTPGQLSSGHVPALIAIKNQLRAKHPHLSEDQLTSAATSALREQSQSQSSTQARQNAMNAAAGIPPQAHHNNMQQGYSHNQAAFQNNAQMPNGNAAYVNGDNSTAQSPVINAHVPTNSPQAAAAYANSMRDSMRQRQMHMMQQQQRMQQSPNGTHAQLNGSPSTAHVSPSMTPASPSMAYAGMAAGQVPGMSGNGRPPSRSNTPVMQRMGSSNSVPGVGMASGMQSPGSGMSQGSPRNMQASMAR